MGLYYSLSWVKFCGRILAVVSYDIRVQFENYATLRQTPILTSKCYESHLHTFVGNHQTTYIRLLAFKGGEAAFFLPLFIEGNFPHC